MSDAAAPWEQALADLWASLPTQEPAAFREQMRALLAKFAPGESIGAFELACSHDSTGQSALAVPLYREAIAAGLSGLRRKRATIQLASSLRNVGKPTEALDLLEQEALQPRDELTTAAAAFQALILNDLGRRQEALGLALSALSEHLPRYNASLRRYAAELQEQRPGHD